MNNEMFCIDTLEDIVHPTLTPKAPRQAKKSMVPVVRIDKDGAEQHYSSIAVATRKNSYGVNVIHNILRGGPNTTGYTWRRAEG